MDTGDYRYRGGGNVTSADDEPEDRFQPWLFMAAEDLLEQPQGAPEGDVQTDYLAANFLLLYLNLVRLSMLSNDDRQPLHSELVEEERQMIKTRNRSGKIQTCAEINDSSQVNVRRRRSTWDNNLLNHMVMEVQKLHRDTLKSELNSYLPTIVLTLTDKLRLPQIMSSLTESLKEM